MTKDFHLISPSLQGEIRDRVLAIEIDVNVYGLVNVVRLASIWHPTLLEVF